MTATWRHQHLRPGDRVSHTPGFKAPDLYWEVIAVTDTGDIVIAYTSPYHRERTSHYSEHKVELVLGSDTWDNYEVIRRENK